MTATDKDDGLSEVATHSVTINTLPDLTVSASDITFSPDNPTPGETVTISAKITNQGPIAASDIKVAFFDFDVQIGEKETIVSLGPGASEEVSIETIFPEEGFRLITVEVDPRQSPGLIDELNEENNEASTVLQVGVPDPTTAVMDVHASATSVCQGTVVPIPITGRANYDFVTVAGTENFPVQGGGVHVTVVDPVTQIIVDVFSGTHTDANGNFSQDILPPPATVGSFTLIVQVTDGTLTAKTETTLEVLELTDPQCVESSNEPALKLDIAPSVIAENALNPATTATVTRVNIDDLSEDLEVILSSSDISEAKVANVPPGEDGKVVIPAGVSSVTFDIDAVDDDESDGTKRVIITASALGFTDGRDTVDVTDNEPALNLVIADSIIAENAGPKATTATVTRSNFDNISGDLEVILSSSDTSEATVPERVTIKADQASATLDIDAVDDDETDGTRRVTITASAEVNEEVFTGLATLIVTDDTPTGDIFIDSLDIKFSNPNPPIGETITIIASVNYSGSEPVSDVPVSINDIFPEGGALNTDLILNTQLDFPGGGTGSPQVILIDWIPRAGGGACHSGRHQSGFRRR